MTQRERGWLLPPAALFFAGGILLYSAIVAIVKSPDLIPRYYAAKRQTKQKYAVQFAKLMALCAAAPVLSGLVGLIAPTLPSLLILIVAFIFCLRLGIQMFLD